MDCRQFHETFSDFLDGLLDEAEEIHVRRHLFACEPCRRFEAAFRVGVTTLGRAPQLHVSREFGTRLAERVRREPLLPALVGWYGLAGGLLTATMAALLILDVMARPAQESVTEVGVTDSTLASAAVAPDEGVDLVTFRVAEGWYDLGSSDPYSTPASLYAPAAPPVRFEVPAAWLGR